MKLICTFSVLIILLLYEEIGAAPKPDWNKVIQDKVGEDEAQSQVPVWARKAGFRVKQRRVLSENSPGEENDANVETKKPDEIIKETEISLSSSSPDLLSAPRDEIGITRSDSKIQQHQPAAGFPEILPEDFEPKQRRNNKNDGISQEKEDPEESQGGHGGYEYEEELILGQPPVSVHQQFTYLCPEAAVSTRRVFQPSFHVGQWPRKVWGQ
ncbi:uncharacterized protein LOC110856328 [Folsomia candida]|uniref:uncharacterized protein LOC110856328 n=1 Tax=Folsomia candida TaxID=158441 RepID=UPI000B8F6852|nr:uncharacterized protein LOC110856328 [Folsomia candida]